MKYCVARGTFKCWNRRCCWETAPRLRSPSCGAAHTTAEAVPLNVFDHPAYSPDLASSDCHLSQHLKRFQSRRRVDRQLSQADSAIWRRIFPLVLQQI
ncbi:hypothetical protein AVEN_99402-1 [Araneus ventricosus]|uniref:Uncharacterized protein n=1 Tax=Araneus ventricosus TaxID=182803 RepID=A0A4Y2JM86_ARAVE|nr:hypothetical protein AVEN_99402-1 [Araneus ventricosus]